MKKLLAISTAVSLSLGGVMTALPANAVGENNPTFSTSAFDATEGAAFDVTLVPTFGEIAPGWMPDWYYGSRAFLDTTNCDALPSGLSYVQEGVENGNGIAPTYQISGTPDAGTAGVYNVCFSTDDNPEGWYTIGNSAPVTITVAAAPVSPEAVSVGALSGQVNSMMSSSVGYTSSNFVWSGTGTVSAIGLPDGLSLVVNEYDVDGSPLLGLSGTPTAAGNYSVQVTITDGAQSASFEQIVNISAAPVTPDYTINCNDPQEAPYVNYGQNGEWYGAWDIDFGGATEVTKTVEVSGCGYYVADDVNGIVNEYVGTSATTTLTVVVPVDGYAYVRGYNTWDAPQSTAFMIQFWNAAPVVPGEPINSDFGNCNVSSDVNNTDAYFEGICEGAGNISDAGTTNTGDAYDGFGDVYGYNWDGSTFLIGASEVLDNSNGVYAYVANGVWSTDAQEYVDVYVNRTFHGNTVTWTVEVYSEMTLNPSTLNFYIDGNLGSDSDTVWGESNGYAVSSDNFTGDPAIIWNTSGSIVGSDGNDDVTVNFGAVSTGTLSHILVGYDSCVDWAGVVTYVDSVTANYVANVDANIPDATQCVAPVTPEFTVDNGATFTNGEEGSVEVTVTATGDWDWSYGGNISLDGLPYGLDYTVNNSWVEGTVPSFNVYGTADDVAGDYTVTATLWDDFGNETSTTFVVTVEAAPVVISADLSLNQPVGSNIADTDADYSAEGLMVESEWTLTLRSTPQVIGSGIVDGSGSIFGTATIPAGLEAGWHSITLTGTDVNGDAVSKVVWFELSADGTILAEQGTEPVIEPAANTEEALVHTGSDIAGGLIAGGTLLAAGLAMVVARRRQATN